MSHRGPRLEGAGLVGSTTELSEEEPLFHRAAAVLAMAGLLAACGGGATATAIPVEPTAQPPSATDAPAATTPPGGRHSG